MSQEQNTTALVKADEKGVSYVPFGAKEKIELSIEMVEKFLVRPTKSGKMPQRADIVKYMMLCKSRELNPWEGDSYLLGFDSQDGPEFSMVTAYQAFLKRAEACPEYDGKEQGVVVKKSGEAKEVNGEIVPEGWALIGAWAKVYRKDRRLPEYQLINLSAYDKGRSQWNKDKAGMIVKCAGAKALRHAFPNKLSQMYIAEERGRIIEAEAIPQTGNGNGNGATGTKAAALKQELQKRAEKQQATPEPEPANETIVTAAGDEVETVTGEVVSESAAPVEPKEESSQAPYPDKWPERRKVEKPKGFAMIWGDQKTATPKFLDKLRKEGSQEALFEMRYRIDQQGESIPKDDKLYETLMKLQDKK